LRDDPIFKIACDKVPLLGEELLASQPTMSRWENQVTNREIKGMRRFFVDQFLKSYSQQPEEILLDIDGWDALTHGHQQLRRGSGDTKMAILAVKKSDARSENYLTRRCGLLLA